MTERVEVLLERLLATERSIAVVAFIDVSWGPEVLVESLLAAKWPIALVALEDVSWGIQVLQQCSLIAEVSIATMTVLGHFTRRLLRRCRPSWEMSVGLGMYPAP
jgi:hypothetical protein